MALCPERALHMTMHAFRHRHHNTRLLLKADDDDGDWIGLGCRILLPPGALRSPGVLRTRESERVAIMRILSILALC